MKRRITFPKDKNDSESKLDPMMKAFKAIHSTIQVTDLENEEVLNKQRSNQALLCKLVTPAVGISYTKDEVDNIPISWARPDFPHRNKPVILYCHGGGYTTGGLAYAGILAGKLAFHTGLEVCAFEYRLSPENPYPAAIEDAVTVWNHLMYRGYGAKDIIVAGDSAGGNLALELTLILKSQKRMLPAGLALLSPWTDLTATLPSYEKYKDTDPMLSYDYVCGARRAYAGADADYTNPSLSPLYADLDGMPPTIIEVGSNEILRSDSEELYKKLHKYGCITRLHVYSGGWHVFQMLPTPKAGKALDDIRIFIEDTGL